MRLLMVAKELAVWLRDPKLDLAHEFKEEGTWNGEVTIDCCDKGKGVNKWCAK